jgi:hypothetical protein
VAPEVEPLREDGEPLMRALLMKLLFGPNWRMVRQMHDGSLEVIRRRR